MRDNRAIMILFAVLFLFMVAAYKMFDYADKEGERLKTEQVEKEKHTDSVLEVAVNKKRLQDIELNRQLWQNGFLYGYKAALLGKKLHVQMSLDSIEIESTIISKIK